MGRALVPSDFSLKAMNASHRAAIWLTRGKAGWRANNMPVLELTTIGRKSGEKRSTMLTSPIRDGESWVVVASRGGDDAHPAWFLNLSANPDVEVVLQGASPQPMTAHVATPAERPELWARVIADHPHYAEYQTKTEREIPLVLLTPLS